MLANLVAEKLKELFKIMFNENDKRKIYENRHYRVFIETAHTFHRKGIIQLA